VKEATGGVRLSSGKGPAHIDVVRHGHDRPRADPLAISAYFCHDNMLAHRPLRHVMLQLPRDGDPRVGKIGAVGAGADGPLEVIPQRRVVGTDTPHGMSDRARHTGSGALCRGTDASIASSESNRA
jgi:hypothetical protein